LIADQTGNDINSFYMTGGVLFAAFLIPVIMIFINRGKSKVHSLNSEVGEAEEERVDTVSKEVQTEETQEFGRNLSAGTLTRMRSSNGIT